MDAVQSVDATVAGRVLRTCLIVDDSKVIRKVARRILEDLNFTAEEAVDGRDALEQCRKLQPDLVLLDWNMPVMSGMDFLAALPDVGLERRPLIVFCTTENDLAHIRAALDAGADEYIMKPFDRDIIEAKLQQVGLL